MLNYRDAAAIARQRILARMRQAKIQKEGLPEDVAIVQEGTSFRNHLLEAMRRSRGETDVEEEVFLAVPERLLGRWSYLAFGPQRDKSVASPAAPSLSADWRRWEDLGQATLLANFVRMSYEAVLLTHGLSPISDSTLLLADIGRGARLAEVLRLPLAVMLADVSWMSYNRSVRRFDLSENEIESGLRLCLDRRERLYEALEIKTAVHSISPYSRRNAVSSEKVNIIADRYLELIQLLWGQDKTETDVPLHNKDVAAIGRPLAQSLSAESPLSALSRFPGALQALESALGPHLNIVRALAQKFRVLNRDTFSYYFAQYYAQQKYRGSHIKVAPISERNFDEPFDTLDDSFRAWGDGHDPQLGAPPRKRNRKVRLTAAYLPQYKLGDWALLPYIPLSLDALSKAQRQVSAVTDQVVLLTDASIEHVPKARSVIERTLQLSGPADLNRLVYDLLWFLRRVTRTRGKDSIAKPANELRTAVNAILDRIADGLDYCFRAETEGNTSPAELWCSWLDSIEVVTPMRYLPAHLLIAGKTEEDWTDDAVTAAAELVVLSNRVAMSLSD